MARLSGLVVGKPDPDFEDKITKEIKRYPALLIKNADERFGAHRVSVSEADYGLVDVGDNVEFDVSISISTFNDEAKLKIRATSPVVVGKK